MRYTRRQRTPEQIETRIPQYPGRIALDYQWSVILSVVFGLSLAVGMLGLWLLLWVVGY